MQKRMTGLPALCCVIILTACAAPTKEAPRPDLMLPPPAQIMVCKRPVINEPPPDMPESFVALQISEIYDAWGDCYGKINAIRTYFETGRTLPPP